MPTNVFFPDTVGIHDNYEVGECVIAILCLNCSGKSFVKQDLNVDFQVFMMMVDQLVGFFWISVPYGRCVSGIPPKRQTHT
jgi:hypothetical protein